MTQTTPAAALWVLVPLYNEIEVLPELQRRLLAVFATLDLPGRTTISSFQARTRLIGYWI